MNGEVAKSIEKSTNDCVTSVNDELDKIITVSIDRGMLNNQNKITNELTEIGCSVFYRESLAAIKNVSKYIRKVDLNEPFKQNLLNRFIGVDMAVDYVSNTHYLYSLLERLEFFYSHFDFLLERINNVENEFKNIVANNDLNNASLSSKVISLTQLKSIKELKLSMLTLDNCFKMILNNPKIIVFCYYWKKYKENNYHFPKECIVNDIGYTLFEYEEKLMIDGINVFDKYNEILDIVTLIKKFSTTSSSTFAVHVGERYRKLRFKIYKNKIVYKMIELLDKLKEEIYFKQKETTNRDEIEKYRGQLTTIQIIKNEFLKLQIEIEQIINNKRLLSIAKRELLDIDYANVDELLNRVNERKR